MGHGKTKSDDIHWHSLDGESPKASNSLQYNVRRAEAFSEVKNYIRYRMSSEMLGNNIESPRRIIYMCIPTAVNDKSAVFTFYMQVIALAQERVYSMRAVLRGVVHADICPVLAA